MPEPIRKTTDVEVRYVETDQMGVVHHSVYLVWFELARTGLCEESGHHYADIEKLGFNLVVTGTKTRHLAAAVYGDTVQVDCWLEGLSSRVLRFGYRVRKGDRELASGATEHVWVDRSSGRPCRTPDVLRVPFERLAGKERTACI